MTAVKKAWQAPSVADIGWLFPYPIAIAHDRNLLMCLNTAEICLSCFYPSMDRDIWIQLDLGKMGHVINNHTNIIYLIISIKLLYYFS
jgi:hypothetical protein